MPTKNRLWINQAKVSGWRINMAPRKHRLSPKGWRRAYILLKPLVLLQTNHFKAKKMKVFNNVGQDGDFMGYLKCGRMRYLSTNALSTREPHSAVHRFKSKFQNWKSIHWTLYCTLLYFTYIIKLYWQVHFHFVWIWHYYCRHILWDCNFFQKCCTKCASLFKLKSFTTFMTSTLLKSLKWKISLLI